MHRFGAVWPLTARGTAAEHRDVKWTQLCIPDGRAFATAHPTGWVATTLPDKTKPLARDGDVVLCQLAPPLHVPLPVAAAGEAVEWLPQARVSDILAARRAPAAPPAPSPGASGLVFCVRVTFRVSLPTQDTVAVLQDASGRVQAAKAAKMSAAPRPPPRTTLTPPVPPVALPVSPRRGVVAETDARSPGAVASRTMGEYTRLVEMGASPSVPQLSDLSLHDLKTVASGVEWAAPKPVRGATPMSLFAHAICGDKHLGVTLRMTSATGGDAWVSLSSHEQDFSIPAVRVPPGTIVDPMTDNTLAVAFLADAYVAVAVNDVLVTVMHVPEFYDNPTLLSVMPISKTREASFVCVADVQWAHVDPPTPRAIGALRPGNARADNALVFSFRAGDHATGMTLHELVRQLVQSPDVPLSRLAVRSVAVMTPVRTRTAGADRGSRKRGTVRDVAPSDKLEPMVASDGTLRLLFVAAGNVRGFMDLCRKLPLFNACKSMVSLPTVTLHMLRVSSVTQTEVSACMADSSCPRWSIIQSL